MTQGAQTKLKLDAIAWKFLGSEFAGQTHADWPIERRLDGYLLHHGLIDHSPQRPAARRHVDSPSLANRVAAASLPPDVSGRRRHR